MQGCAILTARPALVSRKLLASVNQSNNLDGGRRDLVDRDVVRMHHRFACTVDAARAVKERVIGEPLRARLDRSEQRSAASASRSEI